MYDKMVILFVWLNKTKKKTLLFRMIKCSFCVCCGPYIPIRHSIFYEILSIFKKINCNRIPNGTKLK